MASGKQITVNFFWNNDSGENYADGGKLTADLQADVRRRALDILRIEYNVTQDTAGHLTGEGKEKLRVPKLNQPNRFSYTPATSLMTVGVQISDKDLESLGITKKQLTEEYINGATDSIVLEFDQQYSDNSPIIKDLKSLKTILESIVALAEKSGVDLYKEKIILENFDDWVAALKSELKSHVPKPGDLHAGLDTTPILGIAFPNAKNVNEYKEEAEETVFTVTQAESLDAAWRVGPKPTLDEVARAVDEGYERENILNDDDKVAAIGFDKGRFGFHWIKHVPTAEFRIGEQEFENQTEFRPMLGAATYRDLGDVGNGIIMSPQVYPTFVNYIREIKQIIGGTSITSPNADPMLASTDLYVFLENYHYPQDIPLDQLDKLTDKMDDTDALFKRLEQVAEEGMIRDRLSVGGEPDRILGNRYDQIVNAPFSRQDAIETLSQNGLGLHDAYGSLLSDGFNFDSMNQKYDIPWLSYPGGAGIKPSTFISDSTIAQISSGKLLKRIKTIKDIENLIVKRLTIRDLLIMALTCADRYGTPNLNVVERIDKFLQALGNTRIFPVFRTTIPIGDFWADFTKQLEEVIKETVETAVVDFFKQILVMIASCDIEGIGDQFEKGAADLEDLLTNKEGSLLKFADDILTKSLERTPRAHNLLASKQELEKIARIITRNTTPLELRDCLQGNGKEVVLASIAAGLGQHFEANIGRAAVESSLKKMGREDCDLARLDEKIEDMAQTAKGKSAELCADFKQRLREKYVNYDEGMLDEIIANLPDKDPASALAFDPELVLDPCELLKIPDPAGDFMVGSAYDSAFASVKTKFTLELNAFPMFLFDTNALSGLNVKTEMIELDDDVMMPVMRADKGNSQGKIKLLEDYRNLLTDKDGSLVQVVTSDTQQDIRYNSVDPMAKIKRLLASSGLGEAMEFAKSIGGMFTFSKERSVATLSLKKKINPQDLKNTQLVDGSEYDKEIILKNKSYASLSPDGITQQLISITGLHSIEIDNVNETLSLKISNDPPSGQLETAMKSFDTSFGFGDANSMAFGLNENNKPTSQAERFSQVMTKGWKDILGKIDPSHEATFRKAMRIHYPTALDSFAGRFSRKTKYSEFLDADKIMGMGIFDDPLCPTKQEDLLDLTGLISSMEKMRKNLICKGIEEQAALQRATIAGLTKTFMRVIIYEKFLPSIFYFSEIGMHNVNKEVYMAFVLSLFSAEIEGGGDDIIATMAQGCSDLLAEEQIIDVTNTEALKLSLEQVLVEVTDVVKKNIESSNELDINTEKFGEVTDHLLRRIIDTPIIENYGAIQEDLKNKTLTDDILKLDGRTVYPEILNVPTFMSGLQQGDDAFQLVDIARYLTYTYNGDQNDDFIEGMKGMAQQGTISGDLEDLITEQYESSGIPAELYNNSSGKLISLEKQLLKNGIDQKYFKEGGFLLEQFIEVQTKKGFDLKDISLDKSVKKINFNYNPLFTNMAVEDALSAGTYGQISEESFDYINDFLEIDGSTPILNGYVGLDDFYSLATITQNINEGFAELSQIDKDLHDILNEWSQFRHRPTAIPKSVLALENEEQHFKKINSIDNNGNIQIFKTIDGINDLAISDGNRHVPLGAHRLVAPNTSQAIAGGNFSFYIRGDSLSSTKKSMVKYTPSAFVEFEASLDNVDWEKWPSAKFKLVYTGIKKTNKDELDAEREAVLLDTIASFYQVLLKKQSEDKEDFKKGLVGMNLHPQSNIITLPASFSTKDKYLQQSWLNVAYIFKYLNSIECFIEYDSQFTWDVWEGTAYEGQEKVLLGNADIDNPLTPDDCYAVFAKIYGNLSSEFGNQNEERFHTKQLEYDSEEEEWRLSLKSSLLPRLIFYMENLHEENMSFSPIKSSLIELIKSLDFSSTSKISQQLLGFLNLQYGIPIPEEGSKSRQVWDSIFNPVYVDISLPFGKSLGLSQKATRSGLDLDGKMVFQVCSDDDPCSILSAGAIVGLSSTVATSYNEVDEVVFNLNAEELYWHFDHVLKNLNFYGLFLDKSPGANKIKWDCCKDGHNFYPYELVEREMIPTEGADDPDKSYIAWRQFSNPDVDIDFLRQVNKKDQKKLISTSALPLLDTADLNYYYGTTSWDDGKSTGYLIKPSLLFGRTTIHNTDEKFADGGGHSTVINYKTFNWYGDHEDVNVNEGWDDDISEHMGKRYHPNYVHEETARAGFKVLKSGIGSNALPEKNVSATSYYPSEYARIWGIKAKSYPALLNESRGNFKDWDPNWDSATIKPWKAGFWEAGGEAAKAIGEGIGNLFGFSGFTDEENPGPPGLLWFMNQFKEIWIDDHGRRRATLDTLLLNMEFYLNQIENYDILPQSYMNDWTALYVSDSVDVVMTDTATQDGAKSIRIGRTTPAGKYYELNSMTSMDGTVSRGRYADDDSHVWTMMPFLLTPNYDALYGQDWVKGEEAIYTPMIDIPLVRQGISGHEAKYLTVNRTMGWFAANIQDSALFATGWAKTPHNNMYNAKSLYVYDSPSNAYEKVVGKETVAYKLLKNWHDRIRELRDKRIGILNNLKNKVLKFMPAAAPEGNSFFADHSHTEFFKPFKAGVRLSYILPVAEESEDLILAESPLPKAALTDMVAAKRGSSGPSKWYPPLYRKTYEVVERETEAEYEKITNKLIYKIPIAEAKIKLSEIYGVEDGDLPVAFALQLEEDGSIKYDYDKIYEAVFKLKEQLLADPNYQVLFGYALPAEDLSTISALGTYNTVVDSGRPGMGQMFNKTKKDLLDTMTAFSLPLSYDSAALIRSFEEEYSVSTTDPIDETGIDAQMIMQASLMIIKAVAEITDPTVATAKALKDVTYEGVKATLKAGEAAFGGDASGLYDSSEMRYWRSSQAMFPLIMSLLPYPLVPAELLFAMGIIKPFNITPIGMTYWALSPTGLLDPLDGTLTAASKSDKQCP